MVLVDLYKLWRFWRAVKEAQMKGLIEWKKLAATLVGTLIIALGPSIGLSEDASREIALIITGYIVGQGIADHGKGAKIAAAKMGMIDGGAKK